MPREVLEFNEGLEQRNKEQEREEIIKKLNVPNVIGVYANLSPEWQADREMALFVMNRDGLALRFASAELQNDLKVVEVAVANTELAWPFVSKDLQSQRQEIMARIDKKLKDSRREVISKLAKEAELSGEPPVYNPELEKIAEIVKQNWWKSDKPEDRISDVAKALGVEKAIVRASIEEAITPECLVQIGAERGDQKPLVEALKEDGFEINAWTSGEEGWQRKKFERSGASKFIDAEHLFVSEKEKTPELRKILDTILKTKSVGTTHVYVVDDSPEQLREAMNLSGEYKQKGIELHYYHFKLKDPQAEGIAFYKYITQERIQNPDLVLVLDFDQVIADTDGALDMASKNILRRKLERDMEHPKAA